MSENQDKLAVLSQIEQRISRIVNVEEAKSIRDQAEAIRVYAKSARKGLAIQNHAAMVKILAERKAGELLAAIPRAQGKDGDGLRSTMERSEIPPVTGHRWQAMAKVPETEVVALAAEHTSAGLELSSAEVYRMGRGGPHISQNSGENEWYTPEAIIQAARSCLGAIDLDPASHPEAQKVVGAGRFFTSEDDGLARDWAGRVWLNPPYAQPLIQKFVEKLLLELAAGHVTSALTLTNNATDTDWGQALLSAATATGFLRGRVRFWAPGRIAAPLQGQMVCGFAVPKERLQASFGELGVVLVRP